MKKMIGLLLVVFMMTACGTLLKSKTANVSIDKHEYTIYVQAMDTQLNCNITLFVNDTEVAKGTTSSAAETLFISGKYEGIKFDAECGSCKIGSSRLAQQCLVYVKGEKVAELSYKVAE